LEDASKHFSFLKADETGGKNKSFILTYPNKPLSHHNQKVDRGNFSYKRIIANRCRRSDKSLEITL
jgi:hypothetical protein